MTGREPADMVFAAPRRYQDHMKSYDQIAKRIAAKAGLSKLRSIDDTSCEVLPILSLKSIV